MPESVTCLMGIGSSEWLNAGSAFEDADLPGLPGCSWSFPKFAHKRDAVACGVHSVKFGCCRFPATMPGLHDAIPSPYRAIPHYLGLYLCCMGPYSPCTTQVYHQSSGNVCQGGCLDGKISSVWTGLIHDVSVCMGRAKVDHHHGTWHIVTGHVLVTCICWRKMCSMMPWMPWLNWSSTVAAWLPSPQLLSIQIGGKWSRRRMGSLSGLELERVDLPFSTSLQTISLA